MATRYFQYLAGERKGDIVMYDKVVEEDNMVFVCFKDGSRCNEELILPLNDKNWSTQLMAEISDPANHWRFKEEWVGRQEEKWSENANGERVCVQPHLPGRKKIIPIPPRPVHSKFGAIEQTEQKEQPVKQSVKSALVNDPVWVMMDKAKKFPTEISMILTVSLPTKSLYDVAKESFDEGGNKIIEYIISNMDDKMLKDSLKDALRIAYDDEVEDTAKEDETVMTEIFEPEVVEKPVIGEPIAVTQEKDKKEKS